MVVCTHGVRVVRVRFPAVRHETYANRAVALRLKEGSCIIIYMKEEKQKKPLVSALLLVAVGIFFGWLLFGYNGSSDEEEAGTLSIETQESPDKEKERLPDPQAVHEKQTTENLNEYEQRAAEIQNRPFELRDSGDILFEQSLIRDVLGLKDSRSKAVVTHQSGQFFVVDVRVPVNSPSGWGGGYAILKKEGDRYRVLHQGQESPPCDVVEEENIPSKIIESFSLPECWDDEVGWRKPR